MPEIKSEKNYYFFVGTVAELIKLFPVMQEMERRSIQYSIIASGQNDIKNSDIFASIQKRNVDIEIGSGKIRKSVIGLLFWFAKTFARSFRILRNKIERKKNNYLIVHGDTVSTVMGAILGKLFSFKIFHIEAGLRSFNFLEPFPEEIDRVITSRLTDVHFCPNAWALGNLKRRKGEKINTFNNTLIDSLDFALSREVDSELTRELSASEYCLFVCHRQENVSNEELLRLLVDKIVETAKSIKCVFILHAITKIALERYDLLSKLENNKNILLVDRVPYFELMHILKSAEFMVTDGGSNQEECYYLGIPTLILRRQTERNEGLGKNVILSKNDFNVVSDFIKNYKQYRDTPIKITTSPSSIIVDYLEKHER